MMAAAAGAPMEAAQAAKKFEQCLFRSLQLCHSTGSTIAHDVLDVDSAFVSSSASFKQKSTIGVMLAGTTVDNIVIGGLALRLRRRPSFNSQREFILGQLALCSVILIRRTGGRLKVEE
jgi:hypothetical protein